MTYDDELIIKMRKKGKTWKEIGKEFGVEGERVRGYSRRKKWYKDIAQKDPHVVKEGMEFTQNVDGEYSISSEHLFDEQKLFTNDELLEMNNLDPKEFELLRVRRGKWSVTMTEQGRKWNFQSRIDAKPRVKEITVEYIQELLKNVEPREVELITDEVVDSYLLIPFADMHFGLNTDEDYKKLKSDIADRLIEGHREVVIALLGDIFDIDNLLNTTVKGTRIPDVDVEEMTASAYRFLIDILNTALKHSPCVKLMYLQGNHDSMTGYMFVQGIKRLYPDVEVDDSAETLKHTYLGTHSIYLHHGDKIAERRLQHAITGKFPKEWGEAKERYLITGHLHYEKTADIGGITSYQVSSPSKASQYEKDYGFNGAEQVQMVFEFNDERRTAIYYL